MWLFAVFLAVPLIEIALFIQVGGFIGLWPTLLIVVLTALLGTALVRQQGSLAMTQIRSSFSELNDPREPLAHGAMILFSGALLLTPGFFTDAFGFALLVPAFRTGVYKWLSKRIKVQSFSVGDQHRDPFRNPRDPNAASTIDGDFEEVQPDSHVNEGNDAMGGSGTSGWTKH